MTNSTTPPSNVPVSAPDSRIRLASRLPPGRIEAHVVSLKRRWEDRLVSFNRANLDFPIDIRVFPAVDGKECPPPEGWPSGARGGEGGWGCWRSHLSIWEDALNNGVDTLFVFEDDAQPILNASNYLDYFFEQIPSDWQAAYLGGQHMEAAKPVKEGIVRCTNVQRTHAYVLRRDALRFLYSALALPSCSLGTGHIDHYFGPLVCSTVPTYAPEPFVYAQAEGFSDIMQRNEDYRVWTNVPRATSVPVVLITDPKPSGMTLAALRGRGYHCGFTIDYPTGVDAGLLEITRITDWQERERRLKAWLIMLRNESLIPKWKVVLWAPGADYLHDHLSRVLGVGAFTHVPTWERLP